MGGYDPWRDASTRPEVEVVVCRLPAGVRGVHGVSADGYRAILINRDLPPVERLAALAHELAHDERGGGVHRPGLPWRLRALVAREETRTDRVAADRLLPLGDLDRWVAGEVADGRPVTVHGAAEALDVAEWVADHQLRRLQTRRAA